MSIGFKLNLYDQCMANHTVQGQQHTICWHVDDIKLSHVYKQVQDDFEEWFIWKYDTDQIETLVKN